MPAPEGLKAGELGGQEESSAGKGVDFPYGRKKEPSGDEAAPSRRVFY
jgi:hypothetical protein